MKTENNRLGVLVAVAAVVGWAAFTSASVEAAPSPRVSRAVQREDEQIRSVLDANFQACNQENLYALLAICCYEQGATEEFADEARTLCEETDVYLRLADFELIELRPQLAAARVVQFTLPKNEKDRTSGDARQVFYRGRSALLPQWECVEYTPTLRQERGRWKIHAMTTEPKPVVWPAKSQPAIRTDDIPVR